MSASTIVRTNFSRKLSNQMDCCEFWQTGKIANGENSSVRVKLNVYYTSDPNDIRAMCMNVFALSTKDMTWQLLENWDLEDLQIFKQWHEEAEKNVSIHKWLEEQFGYFQTDHIKKLASPDFQKAWEWIIGMFKD